MGLPADTSPRSWGRGDREPHRCCRTCSFLARRGLPGTGSCRSPAPRRAASFSAGSTGAAVRAGGHEQEEPGRSFLKHNTCLFAPVSDNLQGSGFSLEAQALALPQGWCNQTRPSWAKPCGAPALGAEMEPGRLGGFS